MDFPVDVQQGGTGPLCVLLWLLCSRVFSRGQFSSQKSLWSSLTEIVVRACCSSRPRLHPHSSLAPRVCGESTCSRDSFCPSLTTLRSINVSLVGVEAALLGKTHCVPVSFSPFHGTRHSALQSTPRWSSDYVSPQGWISLLPSTVAYTAVVCLSLCAPHIPRTSPQHFPLSRWSWRWVCVVAWCVRTAVCCRTKGFLSFQGLVISSGPHKGVYAQASCLIAGQQVCMCPHHAGHYATAQVQGSSSHCRRPDLAHHSRHRYLSSAPLTCLRVPTRTNPLSFHCCRVCIVVTQNTLDKSRWSKWWGGC